MSQAFEHNVFTKQDVNSCTLDEKSDYSTADYQNDEGSGQIQYAWTGTPAAGGTICDTPFTQRLPTAHSNISTNAICPPQYQGELFANSYDLSHPGTYHSHTAHIMSADSASHHQSAYAYSDDKQTPSTLGNAVSFPHATVHYGSNMSQFHHYAAPSSQLAPYSPIQFHGNNATGSSMLGYAPHLPYDHPTYGPINNGTDNPTSHTAPALALPPAAGSYSLASPSPATPADPPAQPSNRYSSVAASAEETPRPLARPAQRKGKNAASAVQTHLSRALKWNHYQISSNTLICNGIPLVVNIQARCQKNMNKVAGEQKLVAYRRNYISVEAEYALLPTQGQQRGSYSYVVNQDIYFKEASSGIQYKVNALAVRLHSVVDQFGGREIELLQHTAKRNNETMVPVKDHPTYPNTGGVYNHSRYYGRPNLSNMVPYGNTAMPAEKHVFERIQFKAATANNGSRRAAQQYFHLVVTILADIAPINSNHEEIVKEGGQSRRINCHQADWRLVESKVSRGLVVRGRSPSHYQKTDEENAVLEGWPEGVPDDDDDEEEEDHNSGSGFGGNPHGPQQAGPSWPSSNPRANGRSTQRPNNVLAPQNGHNRVHKTTHNRPAVHQQGVSRLIEKEGAVQLRHDFGVHIHQTAHDLPAAGGYNHCFPTTISDTRTDWIVSPDRTSPEELLSADSLAATSESPDLVAHTPGGHDPIVGSSYSLKPLTSAEEGIKKFLPSYDPPRHMRSDNVDALDHAGLTTGWDDSYYSNYHPAGPFHVDTTAYHDIMP